MIAYVLYRRSSRGFTVPRSGQVTGTLRKRIVFIMSHSLLWRHFVLLTVGVYSSNHRVLYSIAIRDFNEERTKRFKKKCRSARPSVCPSVRFPFATLTKKKAYTFFIIDSSKIIRISGERVWHPLQENETIFSKKYFSKILEQIFEHFCTWIQ